MASHFIFVFSCCKISNQKCFLICLLELIQQISNTKKQQQGKLLFTENIKWDLIAVKKPKTEKQTLPSLGKRKIQKIQFQKDILLYTCIYTQGCISLHLYAHTHSYILLQKCTCTIYKEIFKSDGSVVALILNLAVN